MPLPIDTKPNFIAVTHLCGSWLNLVEARGYVHHMFQMLIFFRPIPVSFQLCSFLCWLVYCLVCLWEVLYCFLLLCYWFCNTLNMNVFLNNNQAILGSPWFSFLWLRPDNFTVPFLDVNFHFSAFGYSSFMRMINIWAYWIVYLGEISLILLCFPVNWSTCCNSLVRVFVYFVSPY